MDDLISRQAAIDYCYALINAEHLDNDEMNYAQERVNQTEVILHHLEFMPSAQPEITDEQAIEHLQSTGWMQSHDCILTQSAWDIIRCKDCKHRPKTDGKKYGFDVEFPDEICPAYCDDEYYNWMPDDDFYCARAERRTDERPDR